MNDRGVVYLFAYSLGYSERMAVSLFTLRRHWSGPILLLLDKDTETVGRRIAADPNIDAEVAVIDPVRGPRHSAYITKTLVPTWSPFERSLLIDGDTTIHGALDELFEPTLAITNFSGWISTGNIMSKRIRWWKGRSPAIDRMVEIQLSRSWPAINTGVVGWHKGNEALPLWNAVTKAGAGLHMTDELAMQLLTGDMATDSYRVFSDRYNCSPLYGINKANVIVWHYHGGKHLRKSAGRQLWEPEFRAAFDVNVGGMREWAGQYDQDVAKLLTEA